jgi:hypothetical protein
VRPYANGGRVFNVYGKPGVDVIINGGCDEHPLRCVVSAARNPIDHLARLEEGPDVQDSEVHDAHIDGDSDDEVSLQLAFIAHHSDLVSATLQA